MAPRKKKTTTDTKSEQSELKEGEVIEQEAAKPDMGLAVAHRIPERAMVAADWTPRFAMTVSEAVVLVEQKREFFKRVMRDGVHYGRLPGMPRDAKPALLKPGAELLCASMQLHAELSDAEPPVRDYTGEQHAGEPFWMFRRVCRVYRQTGPGREDRVLIAQAEGSTSSWEKKYRYRESLRRCIDCGQATIIRGKKEWGGGWVCVKKSGGCGAKYQIDDERIAKQEVGAVKNPDVFEQENTGLKMADKRALVATTLIATGCSDIFTQDVEEQIEDAAETGEYHGGEVDLTGAADEVPPPPAQTVARPSKDQMRILTALGNSAPKAWLPAKYAERIKAVGAKGALRELVAEHAPHAKDGKHCEHVQAALDEIAKLGTPAEPVPA